MVATGRRFRTVRGLLSGYIRGIQAGTHRVPLWYLGADEGVEQYDPHLHPIGDPAAALVCLRRHASVLEAELAAIRSAVATLDATVGRPRVDATLLTVEEAAEVLRVSRSRVFELIGSGQLASVKVGKRRCIARSTIDAFVDSHVA